MIFTPLPRSLYFLEILFGTTPVRKIEYLLLKYISHRILLRGRATPHPKTGKSFFKKGGYTSNLFLQSGNGITGGFPKLTHSVPVSLFKNLLK